jgi:hypothetical protein
MPPSLAHLEARGIRVSLDLEIGHLAALEIDAGDRTLKPLHRAPWADDEAVRRDASLLPNLRGLSGDFFCAPFGLSDVEEAPPHGWPANSAWHKLDTLKVPGGVTARFALERRVMGSRLTKEITLRDGHPFVYQRHIFEGGQGAISVAHHPMTRFSGQGRLSFSPKRFVETPPASLEPDPALGRFALAYPARTDAPGPFPLAAGGETDLRDYPVADRHEDFVALAEAPHGGPGWTAVLRDPERDVLVILKDPAELPVTLLWFSNGGRDYPPWNGRHTGVLGIEDARCYSSLGHRASAMSNSWSEAGIPTAFRLAPGTLVSVRHILGALPAGQGWTEVTGLEAGARELRVDASAGSATLPFDGTFLAHTA